MMVKRMEYETLKLDHPNEQENLKRDSGTS